MSISPDTARRLARIAAVVALASAAALAGAQQVGFVGIGRAATGPEIEAWDIDVRPDFKGLPKGKGSVAAGMEVWEAQCAACHGYFGESNEVFAPLVGGTTADDVRTGRVARLLDPAFPSRTTLMKVPTVATLFDYIRRAMPWNAPKSLSVDQVYAVTAYLLNLGGVLPADFTMSNANIAEVQARMPNRLGMRTDHALWPGADIGTAARADVTAAACIDDCGGPARVSSALPDFARNAHGNLAEQNRLVGAQRGADTTRPPGSAPAAVGPAVADNSKDAKRMAAKALLQQYNCLACHDLARKLVGPGFAEVARKYAGRQDAASYLAARITAGSNGVWGPVPMPAQEVPAADLTTIANWLASGAAR